MRGATPPATYALTPREELFHGVAALRLTPVDSNIYGRAGIARPYLHARTGRRLQRLRLVPRLRRLPARLPQRADQQARRGDAALTAVGVSPPRLHSAKHPSPQRAARARVCACISPTKPCRCGERPRRNSARSACRRRSGRSPGRAVRRWRATSPTIPRWWRAGACSISRAAPASSRSRRRKPAPGASRRATSTTSRSPPSPLNARSQRRRDRRDADDLIGRDDGWDVVLAGDVAYERDMAAAVTTGCTALARRGADGAVGDPGRSLSRARPAGVRSPHYRCR